jgi:hypothetical protein
MKKAVLFLAVFLLSLYSIAQGERPEVSMAEAMRSNGKIYVVIAVILTIFAGLIIYLVRLDRKISKLEKKS